MQSSLVRQCLQLLLDEEIEQLLASSEGLREGVRAKANKPKNVRIDARLFRRWMAMPAASDALLQMLPGRFSQEILTRANEGGSVPHSVGVRAVLALHSEQGVTVDSFRKILRGYRSEPNPVADVSVEVTAGEDEGSCEFDIIGVHTDIEPVVLDSLVAQLREQAEQSATVLVAAADEIRAGRRSTIGVQDVVTSWNTQLWSMWSTLGIDAPPTGASFDTLQAVRAYLVEQERARLLLQQQEQQEHERAEAQSKIASLRVMLTSLEPHVGTGAEEFQRAYDRACAEIDRLVEELGEESTADEVIETTGTADNDNEVGTAVAAPLDSATARDVDAQKQANRVWTDDDDTAVDGRAVGRAALPDLDPTEVGDPDVPGIAVEPDGKSADELFVAPDDCLAEDVALRDEVVAIDVSEDLVEHIRAGRFGAAWLVAEAGGLPKLDVMAYRLAADAFHAVPGGIDASDVLIALTKRMPHEDEFSNCQSARVALAATLRASLTAGWIPRSELESIARQANLDVGWRNLVEVATAAGDRNYQHLQDFGGRLELSIDEVHERARALREQLEHLRINFTRADKALRCLLRRQEPLGAALEAVLAPTAGEERREALAGVLAELESPDELITRADIAVNSAQRHKRSPIVAHARTSLCKAIESVSDCVAAALNAVVVVGGDSRVAVFQESRRKLVEAARSVEGEPADKGPGDAAMTRIAYWITLPNPTPRRTGELQVLLEESLPVICAARDVNGLPIVRPENAAQVIEELRAPQPPRELFEAYVKRGDLQEAAAVARQTPELQERLDSERSNWQRKLRRETDAVRAELGRTYSDDFTRAAYTDAEAALVEPANYVGDRFDLQVADLRALADTLTQHREQSAAVLRRRVGEEITVEADRNRVMHLIEGEDFVGANELLALARSGPLPEEVSDDISIGAHVFDSFVTALAGLDQSRISSIEDVVAQFTADRPNGENLHGDLGRLRSWDSLIHKRSHGSRSARQDNVFAILRALGLDTRGEMARKTGPGIRHFELFRVTAAPVDGSLVPGLGSRTTHYMVAATADQKLLRETLSSGFPTKNGPNIVLFDGVLTLDQRRQCLNVCRDNKISAIVVDHAVAAFVAAHYPRSFRAVQQITLPFTCFTHYTVVAGNVPDEVFVGRADELNQLTDRAGSLFVYGGRQLGKSALLRKIQRDFNSVPDQYAIFIDLNSHGIGTWAESDRLWQVLYNELAQIGNVGIKPNANVRKPEPVIRAIRNWLDDKDSRRLLLLLDEADAFLEKESSAPLAFRTIGPLKGLFDNSEGRFKPVFAGLHKVQRLQNVANTPLAHGGRDVLIGPLSARPARDLVVKPLEALGYRFGNPELVWRLLAFTNLQPGLIQVVCNDLVDHLQSRPLHKGEPLITITDADIDTVTHDPRTRDKIAEKLRLTIRLEDRYRVIALAVAIMCMDDSFREKYSAPDIREHCELYWPQGFEDLNSTEFAVYLDELIGLGVLIKDHEGRFSVRSPNVVTMLGSKEQLETELDENKEQFELPHEYNPRSTRRQVPIDGAELRSPLSEHDLSQIIPVKAKYEPTNFVIAGSEALGITTVVPVLETVGAERSIEVVTVAAAEDIRHRLSSFKWAGGGTNSPRIVVIDASKVGKDQAAEIAVAVRSLRKRGQGHLVIVYGSHGVGASRTLVEMPGVIETKPIALGKWSGDGIRSWHDNPFNTPAGRRELLAHSGGWPGLVESAITDVVNRGISHGEEWERLSTFPENASTATQFLHSVGIDDSARNFLTPWAQLGSTTFERIDDIAEVLGFEADELLAIATDLAILGVVNEQNDEYMIDRVVARAVNKLA
ncbi:hypothetical protein [Nocardia sp. NPDC050413]|uniref:hypothetical protein n=1 Tax=Nocardia sp. NPDC050413 TaxID=3155784 RepID=UPI0033F06C79